MSPSRSAWIAVALLALQLAGCVSGREPGSSEKVSVFFVPDNSRGRTFTIEVLQDGAAVGTWTIDFREYTRLGERNWEVEVAPSDAIVRVHEQGQEDAEVVVSPQDCRSGEAHVNVELDAAGAVVLTTECTRVYGIGFVAP